LLKAINTHNGKIFNKVLDLYMRRMILFYTVRFLTWRVKIRSGNETPEQKQQVGCDNVNCFID